MDDRAEIFEKFERLQTLHDANAGELLKEIDDLHTEIRSLKFKLAAANEKINKMEWQVYPERMGQ